MRIWIAAMILMALPVDAPAQDDGETRAYERRVYTTTRADEAPKIDGRLDDGCWTQVEWGSDFVQWEPAEGEPPSQRTAFKILYDESNLYIAYRAYDTEPGEIVNQLARRDWFPGDWVEINIDSYNDQRTAFSFTASVSGTRGDEFISDDGNNWDGNWDPIWEFKSKMDPEGWTAEVRIPLSQLRFADQEEQVWGIQVQRRLYRKEERSIWQPKDKNEPGWVSRFGELRGLTGIGGQKQVELMPYTVSKAERFEAEPGNPFLDGSNETLTLGLDGKIGVTSDLTLDLTVNPDFGQVEADPSQVNLTAFETFFAEKRPFFIEGINILRFQIAPSVAGGSFTSDNLFYSRRIGRRPAYRPDLGDDEFADIPDNSSIIGALKLTGKTRQGLSVGVLESMTARERANIAHLGSERAETVEPFSNYFVGRLQQDFDQGNTRVGGIVTAVNRKIDERNLEFLHESAYTGGIDLYHQWNNRSWYLAANGAMSRVQGEPDAILDTQTSSARYFQRPDNDYESVDTTATSLGGHAGSVRFAKGGGSNLRFETGLAWRSPGFEINDLGFMRRADEVNQFSWVGYSIRNPFSIFRRMEINTNQWVNWDFGGTQLSRAYNFNFNTNFRNNWNCGAGVTRNTETISNNALRGGPSSKWPGYWNENFWVNSDGRKNISYGFGGNLTDSDEGSQSFREVWVDLTLRPSNAARVSFSPFFNRNKDVMQYVTTESFAGDDRYLFGRLDQKTAGMTFRIDYTVTPNLTVQYYGSPFVSSGDYSEFKRITSPHAEAFTDRFARFGGNQIEFDEDDEVYRIDEDGGGADYSFGNPDFNFREFNSNLVMRWEFQPGSLLFLVWSQSRTGFVNNGRFALGDDIDDLFSVHPHNVFLVKINKWFSL